MNNSWLSNSSSPGFIYYDLDTTPSKEKSETESPDFIPFSDHTPSPQVNRFNPTSYSSPHNYRRGSPRGFNKRRWRQNRGNISFSPNTSFNSACSSPRNRSNESNYQGYRVSFVL